MFAGTAFPVYYGDDDVNHQPATLEGGDIHVLGRGVVLVGMGERSTPMGVEMELWPPADVVATAHELAATSGAKVLVTDDVTQAVAGADFVYTDVWVSMGEAAQTWVERVPLLLPYRVTEDLMAATGKPGTLFLHCLPAVHDRTTELGQRLFDQFGLDGAEVTDEVFGSPRSVVFDQAENRLHTIKAVLVAALAR